MLDHLKNHMTDGLKLRIGALYASARTALENGLSGARRLWGSLFRKYVGLFLAVVTVALISNGAFQAWLAAQEHRAQLIRIQQEQADGAAAKITQFIREIEGQLGWTTQLPWSAAALEQRRFDGLRLLRQVPAITELSQLDAKGQERLRVSRLSMDVVGSMADLSGEPRFKEALANKAWYGPDYFRRESEPYMTMSMSGTRRDAGVSVAEVNLKFIWDVITQIKVGERGYAFVIDAGGRLIAHPDISLVLRNTDMVRLSHIKAAMEDRETSVADRIKIATDLRGQRVLTAHATAAPLGWTVFVELPEIEAYAPLYSTLQRSGLLLLAGLGLAFLAGLFLAQRMLVPIQALRAGANSLGAGNLDERITVKTGDELEELAESFNTMAGRLQESYTGLEQKVATRTHELSQALEYQTATSEVLSIISRSPNDLQPVFDGIVHTAQRLCGAHDAILILKEGEVLKARAYTGDQPAFKEWPAAGRDRVPTRAVTDRLPVHVHDVLQPSDEFPRNPDVAKEVGTRSLLAVPLIREDEGIGAIMVRRMEVAPFSNQQIEMLKTFADQAVIAINNVHLFRQVQARTRELAQSVEELKTLGEVSQAVNSTLDLDAVLDALVAKAVELSATDASTLYVYDETTREFSLRASHNMPRELVAAIEERNIYLGETAVGRAAQQRSPLQIADLRDEPPSRVKDILLAAGFRALLALPLVGAGRIVGGLVVRRKEPGEFPQRTIDVMQTFAAQSVIALQNARLFRELEEKGRQLEVASQHKSQFLANMSHELRTPLNAILGYTELILDGIYGDVPEKSRQVLDRVQLNGKHLLGLINDVLDLTKIEAGQLSLQVDDYEVEEVVDSVVSTLGSIAKGKGLNLASTVENAIPTCRGDQKRIRQVLLNLVGNALKFTDKGEVHVAARQTDMHLEVSVRDTGPGIPEADQKRIFEEFQQADSSSTREKGGTGLGLAISKRIVELHGGTIGIVSEPGRGSTFIFNLPLRIEEKRDAA